MLRTGHPPRDRQPDTVRRQSDRENLPFSPRTDLAADDAIRFAGCNIPNTDNFVITCRNNLLAVWRKQQLPHQIAMPTRLDGDDETVFAQVFGWDGRYLSLRRWYGLS